MDNGASSGLGNGHAHDEPAMVDAAVAAIRQEHPEEARWADVAAGFLTAGEAYQVMTQSRLQEFLWYTLPRVSAQRLGTHRRREGASS